LSGEERQELTGFREAADQLMLRKAYAWSLLRWRGQRVPSLDDRVGDGGGVAAG
jgi:hypothetical protein